MRTDRCKVLMVVEATAAGVGRHVIDLTTNFDLDRFDVSVAWSPVRSDERFRNAVEDLEARGVHTHAISMSRGIDPFTDLAALGKLVRLIARERFDVVHVHSSKAGFLGRLASRIARPSSVTVYTPNAISIPLNKAYWYPEKLAGWMTDALLAVSQSEREELSLYNLVPAGKLMQVTAGIPLPEPDAGQNAAIREHLRVPAEAILVGTAGRVSFQKDPQTFLATAELTIQANPSVCFVWIGPGEDLEGLREQVYRRGLAGRVRFTGYRPDAQHLLQGVDIFMLTSRYESFGYVTCEAMALGKPVVASRVTGSSELVDNGVTGFLVPPGNAPEFARALQILIDNPQMRGEFGAAGRRRVAALFSLDRMVAETEQLYLDLVARRRSGLRQPTPMSQSAEAK